MRGAACTPPDTPAGTIDALRAKGECAGHVGQRCPAPAGALHARHAIDRRSAWHNPWLWATVGVAVVAIALGIWGLHERSNADDAKADQQAQEKKPASSTTTAATQTET